MGNPLAGFVKGFANNQVDQIQERRKLENEEKKARMLAQLQADTQRANFLFEEGYKKSNTINKEMSTTDYETGEVTLNALDGTKLGTRKMTKAEQTAYANETKKEQLGITNLESTIASRARDDDRSDRVATAQIGASNRSGRGGSLDGTDGKGRTASSIDIARLIENDYKPDIDYLVKNYNVTPMEITEASEAAAATSMKYVKSRGQSGAFDLARSGFRKTLSDLTKQREKKDTPDK